MFIMSENQEQKQKEDKGNEEQTGGDEKLATDIALGISLGPVFGIIIGMLLFDNIGLGVAFGISFGVLAGVIINQLRQHSSNEDSGGGKNG